MKPISGACVFLRTVVNDVDVIARATALISVYEAPFSGSFDQRWRAAHAVALLASVNDAVLELVIASAERYSEHQHIDDAFPYSGPMHAI